MRRRKKALRKWKCERSALWAKIPVTTEVHVVALQSPRPSRPWRCSRHPAGRGTAVDTQPAVALQSPSCRPWRCSRHPSGSGAGVDTLPAVALQSPPCRPWRYSRTTSYQPEIELCIQVEEGVLAPESEAGGLPHSNLKWKSATNWKVTHFLWGRWDNKIIFKAWGKHISIYIYYILFMFIHMNINHNVIHIL
jgi:hypothetical protein